MRLLCLFFYYGIKCLNITNVDGIAGCDSFPFACPPQPELAI